MNKKTPNYSVSYRLANLKIFGAELQNLLKLFGALVDGSLSSAPSIPVSLKSKELVIY